MVRVDVEYAGELRCHATHAPSGARVTSDAPLDNHGKGQSFSPTDLVATALGACMLTIMGIVAERHGWQLQGARASVEKSMVNAPERRIGRLAVTIRVPGSFDAKARQLLEAAAFTCPVHKSLAPAIEIPVAFEWGSEVVEA
jgi:putative redox protein